MIVKSYSECLYWKIRYIVLSHDDANDVLQNTFLKAWCNINSFHGKSKLSTWLCSIAINEALDFIRKGKNNLKNNDSDNLSLANKLMADEYFDGEKIHAMLLQAVSTLPEVQRTVFNLRYFENMKYNDISEILNTSEGALKASYHIAVKKIATYFQLHE
ncbi:rNA polymerase sigma-70 factor ECF family [Prevotella sp. CAG:1058]|nr:rNA polymerase sigma-70 factor ECF family [Prevotella sp. CAG:1058]